MASALIEQPKTVERMTKEMYEKFDNSSIEPVWEALRLIAIPHLAPKLCPTPYIHAANYFDLLNVYIKDQKKKNVAEAMWDKFRGDQAYRYVAKLRDVIRFSTNNSSKANDILKITDRKISKGTPDFEFAIEGIGDDVVKSYYIKAKQIYELEMVLKLDEGIAVSIDRMHPGLQDIHHVLVVSQVYSADRVLIRGIQSTSDHVKEWLYEKPVPLALGCQKIKLNSNGSIKSIDLVSQSHLMEVNWMPSFVSHPRDCTVIETIRSAMAISHATLNSITLHTVWDFVRRKIIGSMVEEKLCPIPYIGNAHHFDMFSVFAKMPKSRALATEKYVFMEGLRDVLIIPRKDKRHRSLEDICIIVQNPMQNVDPQYRAHLTIRGEGNLKGIHFQADDAKVYKGHIDTTVFGHGPASKFCIDLAYMQMKSLHSILVIDELCVAERLVFTTIDKDEQTKTWDLEGPIPIAFRALKYKLDSSGCITDVKHEISVEKLSYLEQWGYPEKSQPESCCRTLKEFQQKGLIVVKRHKGEPVAGGFVRHRSVELGRTVDFSNLSLKQAWTFLRERIIPEVLGHHYCPLPYLEDAYYYDMFNVFAVRKVWVDRGNNTTAVSIKYSYVDKLENLVGCPTARCQARLKAKGVLYATPCQKTKPYTTKTIEKVKSQRGHRDSEDVHEITVKIEDIEDVHSDMNSAGNPLGGAFFNRLHQGLASVDTVFMITSACTSKHISIRSVCLNCKAHPAEWNIRGPIPIGFHGVIITLEPDGRIINQSKAAISELYPQHSWRFSSKYSPVQCIVLKGRARGELYDVTKHIANAPTQPVLPPLSTDEDQLFVSDSYASQ